MQIGDDPHLLLCVMYYLPPTFYQYFIMHSNCHSTPLTKKNSDHSLLSSILSSILVTITPERFSCKMGVIIITVRSEPVRL